MSTNVCPKEICELKCPQVSPNCTQICLPKECTKIKAENCPLEYCAVMTDCSNEKICHYQMMGEKPQCGDLAYAGQDVECCDGFAKRCGVAFLDGTCDMEGKNSIYNIPICVPCGDGICGQFEDRCNCPEDCRPDSGQVSAESILKEVLPKKMTKTVGNQENEPIPPKIFEIRK